jgi:hypothetical protein
MSNWQKLNYSEDKFRPFHIKLDYCDEGVDFREMHRFDDGVDEDWINATEKEIQDGYKYWVTVRAKVYLAGIEVGSHSLAGLLFDDTDEMESMMRLDYEGIIAEAVETAKHNLKQMSEAMNGAVV